MSTRIYVACLAAYNSGILHGEWIDLAGKDESEVYAEVNAMLAKSPESNVTRFKCPDCGHIQTESRPCDECEHERPQPIQSAEEWAIHDHEFPAALNIGESADFGELCEVAEILDSGDESRRRALLYLVWNGNDLRYAIDHCEDVITRPLEGLETLADVAEEEISEGHHEALEAMPAIFRDNIDWKGIAWDLQQGGEYVEISIAGERFAVTNASGI